MTRINYAFFRLRDGVIAEGGTNDAAEPFAVLNGLKKDNPALEVVVSVGGGGAGSAGFSDMAITAEGRKKFVDFCDCDGGEVQSRRAGHRFTGEYPGYTHAVTTGAAGGQGRRIRCC